MPAGFLPILFDMRPRTLAIVLAGLVVLLLVSRAQDRPAPPSVPAAATVVAPDEAPYRPAARPARSPRNVPLPNAIEAPTGGTHEMDVLAILGVRRRIAREGTAVYLDSMLAGSDSVVVRWADRGARPLRVRFVPDTTIPGWVPGYLDAARAGMAAWRDNAARLTLQEVADSGVAVEIEVHFVASVSNQDEFGVTQLDWEGDGTARHADIRLALRPDSTRGVIPPVDVRRVAIHEFGHALGLPHSGSRDDIMYPSSRVSAPSRRDQATLQLLYAVPPGSIKTP